MIIGKEDALGRSTVNLPLHQSEIEEKHVWKTPPQATTRAGAKIQTHRPTYIRSELRASPQPTVKEESMHHDAA